MLKEPSLVGVDYILRFFSSAKETHPLLVSEPSLLSKSLAADCPILNIFTIPTPLRLVQLFREAVVEALRSFPQFEDVASSFFLARERKRLDGYMRVHCETLHCFPPQVVSQLVRQPPVGDIKMFISVVLDTSHNLNISFQAHGLPIFVLSEKEPEMGQSRLWEWALS
ncbi:hypothetical protein ISTM_406 [Insectomime virus]|uniref:Uncharacterized protein n=1 Tax=Tunisvirus fontaine2 TaxID=1421067 RepID=V9SDZ3_9VIRU|nr:hypothetical protein D1R32_gp396 [Tunisvirus fontaine2]AHA46304.1 hypothetical protein ISTM_406 [Insectomime virus]AHC55113.1 hypothetical protein TNS_ORF395 [Tunisvirus fontaine2]